MQIQINTDDNVEGRESLAGWVEGEIQRILGRFSEQITRIEVHLGDANADKGGTTDKRCMIEARISGRRPEAVSHNAASIDQAVDGAAKKLARSLDSTFGRLSDQKGGETIRRTT